MKQNYRKKNEVRATLYSYLMINEMFFVLFKQEYETISMFI